MMAATPKFKVYSTDGEYVAACKYAEDAAAVVASYEGGTIRLGHRKILFTEGAETETAGNSCDGVAQIIHSRIPK